MLVELSGGVAVETNYIASIVESGADTIVKLALPASTVDVTVSDTNKEQIMRTINGAR